MPLRALVEIRRVLKPGGVLATRDGAVQHFYPQTLGLDHLWVYNLHRAIYKGEADPDPTPTRMPALFRKAEFDVDGGKVRIGARPAIVSDAATRKRLAQRAANQLKEGDPFRQSWLDAGITEAEIEETVVASQKWADTEDAWYISLQLEMLAWK